MVLCGFRLVCQTLLEESVVGVQLFHFLRANFVLQRPTQKSSMFATYVHFTSFSYPLSRLSKPRPHSNNHLTKGLLGSHFRRRSKRDFLPIEAFAHWLWSFSRSMSLWETFRNQHPKAKSTSAAGGKKKKTPVVDKTNNRWQSTNKDGKSKSSWTAATLPNRRGGCLDNGEIPRRDHRRRLGERLAQTKAFSRVSSCTTTGGGTSTCSAADCFKDGSNVIYRRDEDWSSQQTYVNCLFLDHQDTVLAADMSGKVDVIRLPPYGHAGEKARVLGTPLASRLESLPSLKGSSTFKMKSIRGGKAFVMGMPGGRFHVFSTERTATWPDLHRYPNSMVTHQRSSPSNFIKSAWFIKSRPRRRYYRDYSSPQRTLSAMARTNGRLQDPHAFSEIPGWDDDDSDVLFRARDLPDFLPRQRPFNHAAKWDFRETPSSLLSAHVDPEHDCFSWLKIADDRTSKPVVCLDKQQQQQSQNHNNNNIGSDYEEHITACAFASEHCLATSHTTTTTTAAGRMVPNRYNHNNTKGGGSVIKLWDLRMLGSTQKRREPLDAIRLPQFPENISVGLDPVATKHATSSSSTTINNENNPTATIMRSHHHHFGDEEGDGVITALSTPSVGTTTSPNGKLLVTLQSCKQSHTVEHLLLDLGRMEFTKTIRQQNPNPDCNPVYATSGSHDFMACAGAGDNTNTNTTTTNEETDMSVFVYDLNKKEDDTKTAKLSGKKRRALLGVNEEVKVDVVSSSTWSSKFDPILKDRHGLQTTLSCMEMNYDGTAILGGSIDGDLFLWRSP
jgi:hypothetical protein